MVIDREQDTQLPPFLRDSEKRWQVISQELELWKKEQALAKWKRENQEKLTQAEERRKKREATLVESNDLGAQGIKYFFRENKEERNWQLFVKTAPDYTPPPLIADSQFKVITSNLERAQDLADKSIVRGHQQTVDFLTANWFQVVQILYPLDEVEKRQSPVCFSEVELAQFDSRGGRPDIIGFGPDGTLFVLEASSAGKPSQLQNYLETLKTTFPELSIKGYTVSYTFNDKANSLVILPI